ncbi:MAG: YidC/Oxa1 family rane protein insertase [Nocardioidaceae bacterium]|nr:YidC/Oxa1 family rane protein insertase [Nocardioidaceae bacterium]
MINFFESIGHAILTPLYYLTSGVLIAFHGLFRNVLSLPQGLSWALSIVGLTLVIRIALIPLFVKQIKNSRNMQLLQPKVKELQKKYGHDRERLTQETMKLYKDTGTNPLASCFPLLLQMPIFLALFRTLNNAAHDQVVGFLTTSQVQQLRDSTLFGIVKISDSFTSSTSLAPKIFTGCLVVLMTATTFTTQRQLMRKNMPESALTGQYAQQQKLLLYVLPVVFAVGGIAFPIGVLLYWTTSNLWTMGQQFYVIRNNPTPDTPAFLAKQQRDKEKAKDKPPVARASDPAPPPVAPPPVQRVQPKKQSRQNRRKPPTKGQQPSGRAPSKPSNTAPPPGGDGKSSPEGDEKPPKRSPKR